MSLPVNYGNSSDFINLSASLEPKKLLEEMMDPKKFDALEAIRIKDVKIGG